MMRPCLTCGEPTEASRCPEHDHQTNDRRHKGSARAHGYTTSWDKLSKRARRLQPFCADCGATEDLEADHLPRHG